MKEYFTAEEVAKRFRLKTNTIYKWKFEGKIKFTKIGGRLLFSHDDLLDLIGGTY